MSGLNRTRMRRTSQRKLTLDTVLSRVATGVGRVVVLGIRHARGARARGTDLDSRGIGHDRVEGRVVRA
jgi:hypothetical protein